MNETLSEPPDNSRITLDPKYKICRYCKCEMDASYNEKGEIKHSCLKHLPLQFDYYFLFIKDKWVFYRMMIILPNHFRLTWVKSIIPTHFRLQEWVTGKITKQSYWFYNYKSNYNRFFENSWVLKQTPERLLSILNMYKTFS